MDAQARQLLDALIDRVHTDWPTVAFGLRLPSGERILPFCQAHPTPRHGGRCWATPLTSKDDPPTPPPTSPTAASESSMHQSRRRADPTTTSSPATQNQPSPPAGPDDENRRQPRGRVQRAGRHRFVDPLAQMAFQEGHSSVRWPSSVGHQAISSGAEKPQSVTPREAGPSPAGHRSGRTVCGRRGVDRIRGSRFAREFRTLVTEIVECRGYPNLPPFG
jgi:hypothetical protein